jgi:signal transduction histidine kinase
MAIQTLQPRAKEKAQTLDSSIAPSAGFVVGDARRLRDSIEHVLANAIAYTDEGGRIALKAEGDDDRAVIRITDNGSGIAKSELATVFNRFHRVSEAGTRSDAALGLGLPLTRQFIEAHGGSVELQSKKGKGTTVTLIIPRTPK